MGKETEVAELRDSSMLATVIDDVTGLIEIDIGMIEEGLNAEFVHCQLLGMDSGIDSEIILQL